MSVCVYFPQKMIKYLILCRVSVLVLIKTQHWRFDLERGRKSVRSFPGKTSFGVCYKGLTVHPSSGC